MILQKNEPAPYSGVLVPEDHFKEIWGDIEAGDRFKAEYVNCDVEKEIIKSDLNKNNSLLLLLVFSFGLILGGSGYLVLR